MKKSPPLLNSLRYRLLKSAPLRITLMYTVVSMLWILFSDELLGWLVRDPSVITRMAMIKGSVFVLVTALLLYVTILQNVTDLRKSYQAQMDSESRFRLLIENAPVGILITHQGRIVYANPAFRAMYGIPPQAEIEGEEVTRRLAPLTRDAMMERNRQREAGLPVTSSYDAEGIHFDGTVIPFHIEASRFELENGPGTIIFFTDLRERKKVEQDLRTSREQLRALADYLQNAQEEERARIAREIHDDFGQNLTALKMDISWLARHIDPAAEPLREKTHEMIALVDELAKLLRRVATELRPGLLDDLGLAAALEWQAQEFSRRSGIPVTLNLTAAELNLDRNTTTAIFRIAQEALTNVGRHAQGATQVQLGLQADADWVTLTVQDDGRGITPGEMEDPQALGLLGMRERAEYRGGSVKIDSTPGQGVCVTARLPIHTLEDAA